MSKYLSPLYSCLEEYVPGEQPQDKKYIKLNTNESPFSPCEEVIKALNGEEVAKLNLYCDPESKMLKEALAKQYGVKKENVFVANGSDDILNFAFMAYAREDGCAFADITYGFYKVFAQLYGINAQIIPLKADFTLSADDYCGINKFIAIANPNAPTGICLPLSDIEKVIKSNPNNVVLIDEAYVDFGGESAVKLIDKYPNLLVVQTFSKSRSMAGARLGFAIANEQLIKDLEKIKFSTNPYNVNRLTQLAGICTIENQAYYDKNAKGIIYNREFTTKKLEELGFTVLDSKANFIFAKSDKISGEELYLSLKEKGILIRHFTQERIKEFNRITIGTLQQMECFIKETENILKEKNL